MVKYNPLYEGDPQSWLKAKSLVSQLGFIPTSFTTAIRLLMVDHREGALTTGAVSNFLMTRILHSATTKAAFYYSTLSYYGNQVNNTPFLTSSQLLRFYPPSEVAAILMNIYLYRRIRNTVDLDQLSEIVEPLLIDMEIGRQIGDAIPTIGTMRGIMVGSLRYYAQALFQQEDPEEYENYKKVLEIENLDYQNDIEVRVWGCTQQQVAAQMLQAFSFGLPMVNSYNLAFCENVKYDYDQDPECYTFMTAYEWLRTLRSSGQIPERTHDGRFYPDQNKLHKLLYKVNEVREHGSPYRWIEKGAQDITPDITPQLYQETLLEANDSQLIQDFYVNNMPDEVLENLTDDQMDELTTVKNRSDPFKE